MIKNKLLVGYVGVIILLFLYSFTQIDLSLTLSRASLWQDAQKMFQQIGYFNRPLSTYLYLGIITLLFAFYKLILHQVSKNKISERNLWVTILVIAGILAFSYNAFSYDLFNYVFDAKIVTHYFQNPYIHKALDYPGDPMLSFMHWTHRTYPYGPTWLGLTVPLSFIGFNYFLPTIIMFKILSSISFVGATYYIGKIAKKIKPESALFCVALFAFNPLIVVESLVSSHNDISMVALSLMSLYFLFEKKLFSSVVLLGLSVGVKFATLLTLPAYAWFFFRKKITTNFVLLFLVGIMSASVYLASVRTNFQPWYLVLVLPYVCLLGKKYYSVIPLVVLSFGALLQYAPFLYTGNWDAPIPTILFQIMLVSGIVSVLGVFAFFLKKKYV